MKLAAVALDYDGTIAVNGSVHPEVRSAIADLRQRGIAVILVTGRRLADLKSVAGELTCFDVVVAENGAVLEFPATGRHVLLARPPAAELMGELRRRRIPVIPGESVIEAEAVEAPAILEVIRRLEQPLILAFNRGRLMVLPQAVAKSTGLRRALFALRLSIHNSVGVGDAENDHDLLDACEVGVAVQWGSPALRAVADEVIEGPGPAAVGSYLRKLADQARLAPAQMGRRRLFLGYEYGGEPVRLAIRGRTILIAGEPGTGKSWLAGLLCEQLILQGYSLCIVDPEGDYRPLEALPGVFVMGGDDPPPHAREIIRALKHPDTSVIIDLSKISQRRKVEYLDTVLPLLARLRRATGLPHKVLLDEAHHFLGRPDSGRLIDPQLAGYVLVTYRVSDLAPAVRDACDSVVFVTRESDPAEAQTLVTMCQAATGATVSAGTFRELQMSEAALLPGSDESHGIVRRFQLAPRLTEHVRHRAKYLDMPVPGDRAFVFTDDGIPGYRVRTLRDFVTALAVAPRRSVAGHMLRRDFSRWFEDVFRDGALAARVEALEGMSVGENTEDLAEAIARVIRARYETGADDLIAAPVVAPA